MTARTKSPQAFPHHGCVIKATRILRGLTLKEVAADICSLSFLAKIEKGARPSQDLMTLLLKRLKVPVHTPLPHPGWTRAFNTFFLSHQNFLDEGVHQSILGMLDWDYQTLCYLFCRAIHCQRLEKAEKMLNLIQRFEECLLLEEMELFYLFESLYHYQLGNAFEASEYAHLSLQASQLQQSEPAYLFIHLARLNFKAEEPASGFLYLQEAKRAFEKHHAAYFLIQCDLVYAAEKAKLHCFHLALPVLKKLEARLNCHDPFRLLGELEGAFAIFYLKAGLTDKAEMYLKMALGRLQHRRDDERPTVFQDIIIALLELYDHQNNKIKGLSLMEQVDSEGFYLQNQAKSRFYLYKWKYPNSDYLLEFLKKEALPLACQAGDLAYMKRYTQAMQTYYETGRNYKHSLLLGRELEAQIILQKGRLLKINSSQAEKRRLS